MRVGMAAPLGAVWDQRLTETGSVDAQRIFMSLDAEPVFRQRAVDAINAAAAAGRTPIVSTKVPGNDWVGAAEGKYDTQVFALAEVVANAGGAFTVHHEPSGDGAPAAYRAMTSRYAKILPVVYGPILNGFWLGEKGGLSDSQLAEYVGEAEDLDFIAFDMYESDRNKVDVLLQRFLAWADRIGYTGQLALGEIGCYTAESMRLALDVLLAHHNRFDFVCWFNSERNSRADWVLTGDRLDLFKAFVLEARALAAPVETPPDPRDEQIMALTNERDALTRERDTLRADLAAAEAATDSPYTNVKDFGAVCDGITDDTDAVTSALTFGRHVIIPDKATCLVSGITVAGHGQVLECIGSGRLLHDGSPNPVVTVSGGFTELRHVMVLSTAGATAGIRTTGFRVLLQDCTVTGTSVSALDVSGLETNVRGGKYKGGTLHGVKVNLPDLYMANVYVEQNRDGVYTAGVGSITMHHVHSFGNTRHGFYLSGASASQLSGCYADTNGENGYEISDTTDGLVLVDCWSYKSSNGSAGHRDFRFFNAKNVKLIGCRASGAGAFLKGTTFQVGSDCDIDMIGCWAETATGGISTRNVNAVGCTGTLAPFNRGDGVGVSNALSVAAAATGKVTIPFRVQAAVTITPGLQAFEVTTVARKHDNSSGRIERHFVHVGSQGSLTGVRPDPGDIPWLTLSAVTLVATSTPGVSELSFTVTNNSGGQVQATYTARYLGTGRGFI